MNRGFIVFQHGDVETPLAYEADLAARYQHVKQELEAGCLFPSFADVAVAYRDWLDKEGVQQQLQNALQDYPLPPEQQSAMLVFLRQWDGIANTLVYQLEQVVQQVRNIQTEYFALQSIVTSSQ